MEIFLLWLSLISFSLMLTQNNGRLAGGIAVCATTLVLVEHYLVPHSRVLLGTGRLLWAGSGAMVFYQLIVAHRRRSIT